MAFGFDDEDPQLVGGGADEAAMRMIADNPNLAPSEQGDIRTANNMPGIPTCG